MMLVIPAFLHRHYPAQVQWVSPLATGFSASTRTPSGSTDTNRSLTHSVHVVKAVPHVYCPGAGGVGIVGVGGGPGAPGVPVGPGGTGIPGCGTA